MWSKASASTRTSSWRAAIVHPRAEVAGVDARRHARHAPQRRRDARGDREAARERGQHGERPREQELVAHRALGAVRGRRRLAHAEARDRSSVAARDLHEQLDAPAVGKLVEAVAGRRGQEGVRGLVLLALLRGRSRPRRAARAPAARARCSPGARRRARRRARGWWAGTAGGAR